MIAYGDGCSNVAEDVVLTSAGYGWGRLRAKESTIVELQGIKLLTQVLWQLFDA